MKNNKIFCILLLIMAFTFVGSAPVWPTYQYNNQRTGKCPYTGPESEPVLLWSYAAAGEISLFASPVIGTDGTIYFCCAKDSSLYAIKSNGTLKWKYKTGGYLDGVTPAIGSDGTIALHASDSCIYAVSDQGTYAQLKWKYNTHREGFCWAPLTIGVDGTVYSANGLLWAISSTGSFKWNYGVAVYPSAPLAITSDGHTIYTQHLEVSNPFAVYMSSLDTNGTEHWQTYIGGAPGTTTSSAPSIGSDGSVYDPSGLDRIISLSSTGSIRWTSPLMNMISLCQSPAIGTGDTLYQPDLNGFIYKISPSNGSILLQDQNGMGCYASPIIDNQNVIYQAFVYETGGVYHCKLHALTSNLADKWTYRFADGIYDVSTPAMDASGVIYVTGGNSLYALVSPGSAVQEHDDAENSAPTTLNIHPNPFCGRTTIHFYLEKEASNIKIGIYNTAGQLVKTITNSGYLASGSHYYSWNGCDQSGRSLEAGVYFCRLERADRELINNVVLLK